MRSRSRLAAILLVPALAISSVSEVRVRAAAGQQPAPRQATAGARERQAPAPAAAPAVLAPLVAPPQSNFDAGETREQLQTLLRQYPPSVSDVLRIDPSMLTNDSYLATYPGLASYLAQHPEVAHNPAYFVGTERSRNWDENSPQMAAIRTWQDMMQSLAVISVILVVTAALVWVIRTLLDYRRWLRVSRVQAEVHTKLLDRFTSNEDLLAYIQTPAGRKFLESAPIPLDAESGRNVSAPINRILWSVQVGIILAAGAMGLIYLSGRQMPEIGQPMFAMGSVGLALGTGFVVSALISYLLSKRLGLVNNPPVVPPPADMRGAS